MIHGAGSTIATSVRALLGESGPASTVAPFVSLAVPAVLYVHGVRRLTRRRPSARWPTARSACFLAGIGALVFALLPPVDGLADRLLSAHMVQHLLLMEVAAPLLLFGRPITLALATTRGPGRRRIAGLAHGRVGRTLGAPIVGFLAYAVVLWAFHFTSLYGAALGDETIHAAEHLCYLTAALLFWWPVVARDPGAWRLSHPARLLYLFLSMPVTSLLGLVFTSANHVIYAHYLVTNGSAGAALADQRLGGTIMWISSMLVGMIALSAVLLDWMARDEREAARADARQAREQTALRSRPGGLAAGTEGVR